jgi:hypothetical protein
MNKILSFDFSYIGRYYQLPFERISYDYEVEFAHDPIYLAGKRENSESNRFIKF